MSARPSSQDATRRNILLFGLTSFFTDVSSEFIYALQTFFLRAILAANANLLGPVLGLIEGVAEATASLGKVFVGRLADRIRRYRDMTVAGYLLSAASKLLYYLAMGWAWLFAARFLDRVGKAVRTAPRDAIMSESGGKDHRGRAFGLQRAMDFAGAFTGVLLALLAARLLPVGPDENLPYRALFLLAVIPAAIGVVFLFFVQEPASLLKARPPAASRASSSFVVNPELRTFLVATALFALGNSSNQFLILRTRDAGNPLFAAIAGYLLYNLVSTLGLPLFGRLSDRVGRKGILVAGYGLYALVYAGFGLMGRSTAWLAWPLWALYGLYAAMTEGVEKAYVSDLSPVSDRATALGLFATVNGVGLLFASLLAGLLYALGPAWPFLAGSAFSLLSILVLLGLRRRAV